MSELYCHDTFAENIWENDFSNLRCLDTEHELILNLPE